MSSSTKAGTSSRRYSLSAAPSTTTASSAASVGRRMAGTLRSHPRQGGPPGADLALRAARDLAVGDVPQPFVVHVDVVWIDVEATRRSVRAESVHVDARQQGQH